MTSPYVKHYSEIQEADEAHYPGSEELHSIGSPFSDSFGLDRIGVHHELLPPGRRTSYPHAEKIDDEFVYVLEGQPDVWIDGSLYRIGPGTGVGFPAGTGVSHTFINNSSNDVRLLVVGSKTTSESKTFYPLNPEMARLRADRWWACDRPHPLGSHDGSPDRSSSRLL